MIGLLGMTALSDREIALSEWNVFAPQYHVEVVISHSGLGRVRLSLAGDPSFVGLAPGHALEGWRMGECW